MSVNGVDQSYTDWAGATLAAAESYAQEQNDRAWDARTDGVDDPPKTAAERAQDAFWQHDPNRPPPPPSSSSDGGNSGGSGSGDGTSGASGGGDPSAGGGDSPATSTGGNNAPGAPKTPGPIPVVDQTAGGTYPLTPQQAADIHAAGAGRVVTDGKGNYFLDTRNDGGIAVTHKAAPEPPPPSPPPFVWTPSHGGSSTSSNDPPADPPPNPPSLPQEPGLVPSPIQLDDLIPIGTIAKGIGKLGQKIINKVGKELAEKAAKEAAEKAAKEAAEKAAKEGTEAGGKVLTEGGEGAGKTAPTGTPRTDPPSGVRTEKGEVTLTVQGVPKPTVDNPKLNNLVNDLYKGAKTDNPIGTGSTADAIRHEQKTGQPVGGKFHTQKGEEYARALEKWLEKNPNASESDRAAARAMLDDLQGALEGR
jgi:hypothetical protein